MNCPYCNNTMSLGSIDVYDTLSWTPLGEKRKGASKFGIAPNGILLAKFKVLTSSSKESYYCKQCKKIVIDTQ